MGMGVALGSPNEVGVGVPLTLRQKQGTGPERWARVTGDSLEAQAKEVEPLFCNRGDDGLEIWKVRVEGKGQGRQGEELTAEAPPAVR